MRKTFAFMALLITLLLQPALATNTPSNVDVVKNMFSDFAEGLNINTLDKYYTKDFVLESNKKTYDYAQYKKLETDVYKHLASLKVSYEDIFGCGDMVTARMNIKLTHKNGKQNQFYVLLIAKVKNGKISKVWELTNPSWSDKVQLNK